MLELVPAQHRDLEVSLGGGRAGAHGSYLLAVSLVPTAGCCADLTEAIEEAEFWICGSQTSRITVGRAACEVSVAPRQQSFPSK